MKKTKKSLFRRPVILSLVLLLVASGMGLASCDQFGATPRGDYQAELALSPQYDPDKDIFVNRRPDILDTMTVWQNFWADPLGRDEPNFLFNSNQGEPDGPLPEGRSSPSSVFAETGGDLQFIWLGHWTVLMSIDGKTILIDPVFSEFASPVPVAAKRFQPPVMSLEDLPPIDHILISHDHYDHLDMDTIKFFVGKDVDFVVPIGVGVHLRYWGIEDSRITELDWWEQAVKDGLLYIATPAQHFSGRGILNGNTTLWASWVLKAAGKSVYFSGDSGYDTHYEAIGNALGPFDLVFMDYGQYDKGWQAVHNLPEEGVQAFEDLRGDHLVPVGWGMFNLAVHNWYDPPREATRLSRERGIKLITPRLGQPISMDAPPLFDEWWREMIER